MPLKVSYIDTAGKLLVSEMNPVNTYKIIKLGAGGMSTQTTGITGVTNYSDYFLSAGVTYTFSVIDQTGATEQLVKYVDYDNSFLINSNTKKNQQISIVFDENISSFKPVRKDSLIETIGSKYPYIIRNSAINYKTMSFSGHITAHMDIENISGYGLSGYYGGHTDIVHIERKFRDWFEAWINDGAPKIIKTPTEGIRVVRIHDLDFTPIRQLGRLIYSFSCTITEIADYSITNILKYKFSSDAITEPSFLSPNTNIYPNNLSYPSGLYPLGQ